MGNIKAFFGNPYYLMTTVLAIAAFGFAARLLCVVLSSMTTYPFYGSETP